MTPELESDEAEIGPFVEEFLQDIRLQGKSSETVRAYRSTLRNFYDWYDKDDPRELEREDLKDFLFHLKE